jgi:DNA polymerase III subunit gamma/tau
MRPAETSPAPEPAAPPMETGDWRQRLHTALMELNMPFTADAVENSRIVETNGELQFVTSAAYKLALRPDDLNKALKQISSKPYRIKVTVGDAGAQAAPLAAAPAKAADDTEATSRALSNPEVQRFREVFGGEIRKVRNLKE